MEAKEFNLLEEPWIRVITPELEQKEVSLIEALVYSHTYKELSGEMPTQDAAILRVLLAVVETIFYRYTVDGEEEELSEENDSDIVDVLERWRDYWDKQSFPEEIIRKYLKDCQERFWLFHPDNPFWQVGNLQYGTEYGIECLLGNIKESNNKATRHHFSMRDGEELKYLNYAEAARWLIHLNAYAVNLKVDKKAPGPGLPVGIGKMGQLGFIMVNGENLFQILMLNLCPLKNGIKLWGLPKPVWEKEACREQGCKIVSPDNLPELYTIQSRRIMLKRNNEHVTGFRAIGGDFYPVEEEFNEQMTLWREIVIDKKTKEKKYIPQLHNPEIYAWRELPTMFQENKKYIPGIIQWLNVLKKEHKDILKFVTFRTIGIVYGDKMNYTYGDCVNDTVSMSAEMLSQLDGIWIRVISEEVEKCQSVAAKAIDHFSSKICKLFYGNGNLKGAIKSKLAQNYYFSINKGFREWLISIIPSESKIEEKREEWRKQSLLFAKKVVEDYISTLDITICYYREVDKKLLTVSQILNEYYIELYSIYK